jgi:hypothetical protein
MDFLTQLSIDRAGAAAAAAAADPPELRGACRFHAIHLGASVEQVPQQFIDLLRPGGRLVLPLGAMHGSAAQVTSSCSRAQPYTLCKYCQHLLPCYRLTFCVNIYHLHCNCLQTCWARLSALHAYLLAPQSGCAFAATIHTVQGGLSVNLCIKNRFVAVTHNKRKDLLQCVLSNHTYRNSYHMLHAGIFVSDGH